MNAAVALAARLRQTAIGPVRVFLAPGRVNLIGGHTDHHDGFVLPLSIAHGTLVAVAPRRDRVLAVRSENFGDAREIDLRALEPGPTGHWSDHVRGVAAALERSGHRLRGADLLVRGGVPIGAGLGSSSSFQVATAAALAAVAGLAIEPVALAKYAQQAELEHAGNRASILDAYAAASGRPGHALLLDCRSLEHRLVPLSPADTACVAFNTLVKHERAAGEHMVRRAECEAGLRHLQRALPDARALRDVTPEQLARHGADLAPVVQRRCRHVVTENARVQAAAAALERGDAVEVGRLLAASHASLRDDFQVSCPELEAIVDLASKVGGVHGAAMTGGGFGGNVVVLVHPERIDELRNVVTAGYRQATGRAPEVHVCRSAGGVGEVTLER